ANPTGEKPAQNYMDVFSYFNNLIDGVLICDDSISFEQKNIVFNVPSTIVKVDQHNFEIIREGAIKRDDIIRKIL
ncbi:MAG TPA: hypothetical protein PLB16_08100, partial [bacterium]|nr:hypothetical protein [bacterium]